MVNKSIHVTDSNRIRGSGSAVGLGCEFMKITNPTNHYSYQLHKSSLSLHYTSQAIDKISKSPARSFEENKCWLDFPLFKNVTTTIVNEVENGE
ncbi:hypothetical protein AVEN_140559-1 [Araneus ventricosus]|uniref:Uncharacterized protein n=1 Tax=Araneus ventricosus TaxID=182803 RepID=A0A4Y2ISS8_ARAVE|nr:hypothetical protein AVEN_140559-1 [Araneus ventricosus]